VIQAQADGSTPELSMPADLAGEQAEVEMRFR
jgi:hypothetical protein